MVSNRWVAKNRDFRHQLIEYFLSTFYDLVIAVTILIVIGILRMDRGYCSMSLKGKAPFARYKAVSNLGGGAEAYWI